MGSEVMGAKLAIGNFALSRLVHGSDLVGELAPWFDDPKNSRRSDLLEDSGDPAAGLCNMIDRSTSMQGRYSALEPQVE